MLFNAKHKLVLSQENLNEIILKTFVSILIILLLCNCVTKKDIVYLQNGKINPEKINNDYQLFFKPDDLLQINISSSDIESVQPFNLPVVAYSTVLNSVMGQQQFQSYLIDKNGNIEFPVLGSLKMGGLSRVEGIELLRSKLDPDHIKDPIININIANFKITVQGDVQRPGTFNILNERISIFDALGLAGDINISANRENILVIREEGNVKKQYRLNLKSNDIFNSKAYYLQQNDVVYVEPNNAKMQDAAYTRSTGLFISLASVIISLLTVITR